LNTRAWEFTYLSMYAHHFLGCCIGRKGNEQWWSWNIQVLRLLLVKREGGLDWLPPYISYHTYAIYFTTCPLLEQAYLFYSLSLSLSPPPPLFFFPFLLTLTSKGVHQQSLDHNHIPLANLHRLSFFLSLFLSLHEICAFGP